MGIKYNALNSTNIHQILCSSILSTRTQYGTSVLTVPQSFLKIHQQITNTTYKM